LADLGDKLVIVVNLMFIMPLWILIIAQKTNKIPSNGGFRGIKNNKTLKLVYKKAHNA
jgi:hypothetical protein